MNITATIETYLQGWELGDGALSLGVTAECFCYDDPNTGRIERHEFVEFNEDFKRAMICSLTPILLFFNSTSLLQKER